MFKMFKQHRKFVPNDGKLMRLASLYVISKNDYMFNRVVEMWKHRRNANKLMYKFYKKMDDKNRFLHDHIQYEMSWFKLRAIRPRVKSIEFVANLWQIPLGSARDLLRRSIDNCTNASARAAWAQHHV